MTFARQQTFLPHIRPNGDYEVFVARNPSDKWEVHLAHGIVAYYDSEHLPDKIKEAIARISVNTQQDVDPEVGWKPQGGYYAASCPEYRIVIPVELVAEMKKGAYFNPDAHAIEVDHQTNHIKEYPQATVGLAQMGTLTSVAGGMGQLSSNQYQNMANNPYYNQQAAAQQMQNLAGNAYYPTTPAMIAKATAAPPPKPSVFKKWIT